MFGLSASQIFASIVFGSIGFVIFVYGKKQASWRPMAWGILLMVLPYIVLQATPLWIGGALILFAMYVFRE